MTPHETPTRDATQDASRNASRDTSCDAVHNELSSGDFPRTAGQCCATASAVGWSSGDDGRRGDRQDAGVEGASRLKQMTWSKGGNRWRQVEGESTNNAAGGGTARGGCGRDGGGGKR